MTEVLTTRSERDPYIDHSMLDTSFFMGNLFQDQRRWSDRTFGPGDRTLGVIDHIRKELKELEANPEDVMEWIDLIILAADGATRKLAEQGDPQPGYTVEALYVTKMQKNKRRQWPDWRTADPDKAIEHVRGIED